MLIGLHPEGLAQPFQELLLLLIHNSGRSLLTGFGARFIQGIYLFDALKRHFETFSVTNHT
jgi:hypothetical protein